MLMGPFSLYLYLTLGQNNLNVPSSSSKETPIKLSPVEVPIKPSPVEVPIKPFPVEITTTPSLVEITTMPSPVEVPVTPFPIECGTENKYTFGTKYLSDNTPNDVFIDPSSNKIARRSPVNIFDVSSKLIRRNVIDGQAESTATFPWIADLSTFQIKSGEERPSLVHFCSAAIISEYFLLTAAHCVQFFKSSNVSSLIISVGEYRRNSPDSSEEDFKAQKLVIHESFQGTKGVLWKMEGQDISSGDAYFNDIALIKVEPKDNHGILFDKHVQPICLPNPDVTLIDYRKATVAGWGTTPTGKDVTGNSGYLHVGEVPILSHDSCQKQSEYNRKFLDYGHFCAGYEKGGAENCIAEEGGPLVQNINGRYILLGLKSFGPPDCKAARSPAIFTSIEYFLPWILSNMEEL